MGTKKTAQPRSPTVVLGRTSPSASSSTGISTAAAAADQRAARQMAGQLPLWTRMRQPRFMRKGPYVTKEMRFSS